jgi:hypothetical protein
MGLDNGWTKKVVLGKDPSVQLLVGGHFVDAIGSAAVERVHQAPHLLLSTTFAEMYRKFLPMVVDWASKNRQYASDDLILDVHAGVWGTYICFLRFGTGGGDLNYDRIGNKGVLRSTLVF